MPKCKICGKELANPDDPRHINSKYHQDALKKLEEKKKKEQQKAKPKPKPKPKEKKTEPKPKKQKEKKTKTKKKGGNPNWKKIEDYVSLIGKWAWLILVINGIIYIIAGIWGLSWTSVAASTATSVGVYSYVAGDIAYLTATYVWYIIGGIITIVIAILIIKRRFSDYCAAKDWDHLLNDVLIVSNYRIPWMLIFGIVLTIFSQWWGGLSVLVPALLLIFWGPKEYQWKVK